MSARLHADVPVIEIGPYRVLDYDRLPNEPRCELVFGRLYVTPSPFLPHQVVSTELVLRLHRIARDAGGLLFHAPSDVVLADHSVVQPDLVYVSASRLAILGNRVEGAPDLVVEILSQSTARLDRGRKMDLYAASGIGEYWLVTPEKRQIEFLVNRGGAFVPVPPAAAIYRSPAVPELHLDVVDFWRSVDTSLGRLPGHGKQ